MRRLLLPLIIVGVLLAPAVASAVDWFPIVPCGIGDGPACTTCDLFKTFKNVIDFVLYGITGPIAAFMIVWAGGMMLLGGAKPELYGQGTKMLTNTLIGVSIILLSWLVTNTLIKSLAAGNDYDAWYEFSCPAFLQQPEAEALPAPVPEQGSPERPAPELALASEAVCDPANLAAANNVPYHAVSEYRAPPNTNTALNSASLNALIACINIDPIIRNLFDPQQLFTYGVTHPLCNLTHGNKVCGSKCDHSANSCHYGGQTGNQGAMAVDYNWNGRQVTYLVANRTIVYPSSAASSLCATPGVCRTVTGETGLYQELERVIDRYGCAFKLLNFERDHTHISTADCKGDGNVIGGRVPPIP